MQSYGFGLLDALFSALSCVVSVPFYTAFLPLLFWVGTKCFVGDVRIYLCGCHNLVLILLNNSILLVFCFCVEWSWPIGEADDVVDGVL